MALTLNTNIDSLTAQNNLSGSQALLSQSLTRLSSGLRINTAADDAAGLAISQRFMTQINGTNQAISNANNAISEAQTDRRRVDDRGQQPAEHPHARGRSGERLEQRVRPRGARSAGPAADFGNHAHRVADLVQRFERAERDERRHQLSGRRERRRHDLGEPRAGRRRQPDRPGCLEPGRGDHRRDHGRADDRRGQQQRDHDRRQFQLRDDRPDRGWLCLSRCVVGLREGRRDQCRGRLGLDGHGHQRPGLVVHVGHDRRSGHRRRRRRRPVCAVGQRRERAEQDHGRRRSPRAM